MRAQHTELSLRLTCRITMVLAVIAAQPGLSDSEVAGRAGISDQGRVSNLLARLNRLGLIANMGAGRAGGGANAWRLSPAGRRLERQITRVSVYAS